MYITPCFLAIAHHLELPVIGLHSSIIYEWLNEPFGNPLSASFVSSTFLAYSQYMNFPQRVLNTVNIFLTKFAYHYYSQAQNEYVEKYLGPGFPSVYELNKNVSLLLINTHYSINGLRPLANGVIEVGGVHIQDNGEKLPLVDTSFLIIELIIIIYDNDNFI